MPYDIERRAHVLTDGDIVAIVQATVEALNLCQNSEEFKEHHRLIGAWLKREERRAEFREKIKAQVGGWVVVGVLTWIGYAVWEGVKAALHVKGGGQ